MVKHLFCDPIILGLGKFHRRLHVLVDYNSSLQLFCPFRRLAFFSPAGNGHRSCTAWPFFSEERPCHAVSKRFHGEKHSVFGEVRRVWQRSRAEETMVEDSLCHLRSRWKFSGCWLWPDPFMVDSEELFPAKLPRCSEITGLTWVCLKMLAKPLNPMVFMIIIPFLNGYFIGNIPNMFRQTHLSTWKIPQCFTSFHKKSVVSARLRRRRLGRSCFRRSPMRKRGSFMGPRVCDGLPWCENLWNIPLVDAIYPWKWCFNGIYDGDSMAFNGIYDDIPSGDLLHSYGKIHHAINRWTIYFYGPSIPWLCWHNQMVPLVHGDLHSKREVLRDVKPANRSVDCVLWINYDKLLSVTHCMVTHVCLVVSNMNCLSSSSLQIWDVILPVDQLHHFSRWVWLKPATSIFLIVYQIYKILSHICPKFLQNHQIGIFVSQKNPTGSAAWSRVGLVRSGGSSQALHQTRTGFDPTEPSQGHIDLGKL